MKIYFISIFIPFTFFIISCKDNTAFFSDNIRTSDTIHIDPKSASGKRTGYSDWFEKIEYIPVPTDTNVLIGKVDKLLVTDDYIFIMDRKISRSVLCIDHKGNHIFSISRTGNGPGDYISMNDIVYDQANKELIVHAYIRKKLIHFDMEGNFIKEDNAPYMSLRVQPVGNSYAYFCEFDKNPELVENGFFPVILLTGPDRKTIKDATCYLPGPVNKKIVWTSNPEFSVINDSLYSLKPDHTNIVYHITPDSVIPAYTLDFGKYNIDKRYWDKTRENKMTLEKINEFCNNEQLCESFYWLEGENYASFSYRQSGKVYKALYSKKTKTLRYTENFLNDMDYATMFRPVAVYNDKLYCLLESEDAFQMKDFPDNYIPDIILDTIQEFGNPVIAAFTLKPF